MTSPAVRVVKLGGSLLDWPEWVGAFRRWLTVQPPAADVIIVGGGAIVECIRAWDRVHSIPDETAHWLAVDAMSLTAPVAAERLSEAKLVRSLDTLQLSSTAAPQILDVRQFLREQHGKPDALPCSWDVTSDSIAARVATTLQAGELVLLKSTLPAEGATYESLAGHGFVDDYFPEAARWLDVRLVSLRDPRFAQIRLSPKTIES